MDEGYVIKDVEEALDKAREGFDLMVKAKHLLMYAEAALSVSALKCELMTDKGDEEFQELMNDMDFMREIVTFTLNNWPKIDTNKKTL